MRQNIVPTNLSGSHLQSFKGRETVEDRLRQHR